MGPYGNNAVGGDQQMASSCCCQHNSQNNTVFPDDVDALEGSIEGTEASGVAEETGGPAELNPQGQGGTATKPSGSAQGQLQRSDFKDMVSGNGYWSVEEMENDLKRLNSENKINLPPDQITAFAEDAHKAYTNWAKENGIDLNRRAITGPQVEGKFNNREESRAYLQPANDFAVSYINKKLGNNGASSPTGSTSGTGGGQGGEPPAVGSEQGNDAPSGVGNDEPSDQKPPAAGNGGGAALPAGSKFNAERGDALFLQYDNAPDRDDGQAIAAGKSVVDKLGLSNVFAVNGTYSSSTKGQYQGDSEGVMNANWGSNWLDAHNNKESAVSQAADTWINTIRKGGHVWVAEGGPSDFSAAVLKKAKAEAPDLDFKSNVHIVQHSHGKSFNEAKTTGADMNYVKENADYITIDNGNKGGNKTANFNQKVGGFAEQAKNSANGKGWESAFNYLNPNSRLDFSDTVELLHIVGDGDTKDANDFASKYL